MQRINLNKLYYFYIVAKEGSVKSASQKLHLTQPTVSTQIKQLEDELGFSVFTRHHRRLELNRNGRFVLRKAEKLFELADELETALPQRGKAESIKIKIGAIQSLSNTFIYNFSLKLWQDPSIEISITQGAMDDLIKKLDKNDIDILLSDNSHAKSKKYKSIHLGQDKMVAVAGKFFTKKEKKFPLCLDNKPYLAFSNQGRLQDDIQYFFERSKIQPDKVGEVDDVTLMRVITENSHSFSILPFRSVKESIKQKKLKVLGELQSVQLNLWAIIPSFSSHRTTLKKLINSHFVEK